MNAQCPQCEAHEFHAADNREFLACMSCGAQTGQAELVQQVARNAWLLADALAERAKQVVPLAN